MVKTYCVGILFRSWAEALIATIFLFYRESIVLMKWKCVTYSLSNNHRTCDTSSNPKNKRDDKECLLSLYIIVT